MSSTKLSKDCIDAALVLEKTNGMIGPSHEKKKSKEG